MSEGASEVPLHQQDTSLCASRGGKPMALKEDEIANFLLQLSPKWELSTLNDGSGGSVQVLRKQLLLKDFASALDAVNQFGAIAEAQNHHPNLHIVSYRTVIVELYTFSVKGLALNDFIVASKFDHCKLGHAKPKKAKTKASLPSPTNT